MSKKSIWDYFKQEMPQTPVSVKITDESMDRAQYRQTIRTIKDSPYLSNVFTGAGAIDGNTSDDPNDQGRYLFFQFPTPLAEDLTNNLIQDFEKAGIKCTITSDFNENNINKEIAEDPYAKYKR